MFEIIVGLIGGLGLFIYGMQIMSNSLKVVAGDRMKHLLEVLTSNRFKAIICGIVVTIMVQSSSTTTVMVVGFVNASLMNLTQAAGIILGANIGTTVMAQLIAFNFDAIAPILIGIGTVMSVFGNKKKTRDIGTILLGIGILFFGISTMSSTMEPLKDNPVFKRWLITYGRNPILGLLIGTVITGIMQSSGATLAMLQALAISGIFADVSGTAAIQICIPMMIGTNIGTCVTALLSSIGTSKAAKNAAIIHLSVNIFGAIWVMTLLAIFNAVLPVNPIYQFLVDISGTMKTSSGAVIPNVARQIAMSHTFFNVANMFVMLPFIDKLVNFLETHIKDDEEESDKGLQLDDRLLNNPAVAIGQVGRELVHMAEMAEKNLKLAGKALVEGDEKAIEKVYQREDRIDEHEKGIIDFVIRLSNLNVSQEENDRLASYLQIAHDIERIGDHAENIVELAEDKIEKDVKMTEAARNELLELLDLTYSIVQHVKEALDSEDDAICMKIYEEEERSDDLTDEYKDKHIKRLSEGTCQVNSSAIYFDLLVDLERVGDHAANIAEHIQSLHPRKQVNELQGVVH
ncbi:MAG: Na/Pi cotransporter family protein [Eubacteriaceae bacterium]|jgi:phosphate:Na+ symporter|uniref:Na/Pi cotransporter family protein n=1 Tax=Candidatus Pseudoramibacter fermentans TaxID=2594427 RepID=A0A6L5GQS9_9FIRM|nr:Na/Pi cotransporter family protein [Candidatus Pseudoramibacter fermentans]RRF94028.1 MAG: Na/Pi cotransporter family protein [Eubacteriaceae bacterium]